jgi:hypothetical protein
MEEVNDEAIAPRNTQSREQGGRSPASAYVERGPNTGRGPAQQQANVSHFLAAVEKDMRATVTGAERDKPRSMGLSTASMRRGTLRLRGERRRRLRLVHIMGSMIPSRLSGASMVTVVTRSFSGSAEVTAALGSPGVARGRVAGG